MVTQLATREPASHPDRRRYQRHALHCQCWLEGDELTLYGSTIDIGVGGLFLRTAIPVPEGSHATLTLKLTPGAPALVARAVVARAVPVKRGAPHGVGLEFVDIERGRNTLEDLLRSAAPLPWL